MSLTVSWLLLGAALVLSGARRPATVAAGSPHRVPHRARRRDPAGARFSPRALAVTAGVAAAAVCVLVAGPAAGASAAVLLAPGAALFARRLAARPARTGPQPSLPLALDLAAAALRAGQSVAAALRLGAPVLPGPLAARWQRAAGLLALGADPEQAWAVLADEPALAALAATARRSADSGARLARTLGQLAADTRAELRAAALARANRAGVFAMAPLGLCFLPAFVCLGIVPTIVGIARAALPGLR